MLNLFEFVREMNFLAVTLRMLTAVLCGGLIGLEREIKRRPAGMRTHILICVGGAMTILTNLYLYQVMHLYTDISRMGAQVIAGISFIGAGTIIVSKHKRVKGLTTAAGLWAVGILGLVCGAGYIELALFVTAMILLAEIFLSKLEYRFARRIRDVNLYVEYRESADVQTIMDVMKKNGAEIADMEISRVTEQEKTGYAAVFSIQARRSVLDETVLPAVAALSCVITVEEL